MHRLHRLLKNNVEITGELNTVEILVLVFSLIEFLFTADVRSSSLDQPYSLEYCQCYHW